MMKQLLGVPVFDISKRTYLGQYLYHTISFVGGKKVWEMVTGVYNLFAEDEKGRLYPMLVNGLPTPYFALFLQGVIKPKMFYEQKKEMAKFGIDEDNIINMDYVVNGRDTLLFVDTQNIIEDVEFARKLDTIASLKEILKTHQEKINNLKLVARDYKDLYELCAKEKELVETQLERYKTFYHNIRITIIEMETEIDKLRTIVERVVRQADMEKEERERLETIVYNLRNYIRMIKETEEKIEKETSGENK
jgi:hypothetical protein